MATVYSVNFATGKFERMVREGKEDLEVGRVLQLWGYDRPEAVITGKTNAGGKQVVYQVIWLSDKRFGMFYAHELNWAAARKDDRIIVYITDRIMPRAEFDALLTEANIKAEDGQKTIKEGKPCDK